MSRPLHVLVAFGGPSPEHEVSVLTGMQILSALRDTAHTLIPLYVGKNGKWHTGEALGLLESYRDLPTLLRNATPCTFTHDSDRRTVLTQTGATGLFRRPRTWTVDIVIPAFHGSDGENGAFQGVCEVFNLPYTSSGVTASAIGMDKRLAKAVCRAYGFPVVPDVSFRESEWADNPEVWLERAEEIGYPLFVKPVHLGSSIGVSRAIDRHTLRRSIEEAFRYDPQVLVEQGVYPLREINCSVIGTPDEAEASVCEQPVGSDEMLSFKDKYQSGDRSKGMASAGRLIPAPITQAQSDQIRQLSVGIFKALGCSGVVRLDFLMNDRTGEVFFNEINTQPGSFSFYLWSHQGVGFPELLDRILRNGLSEHRIKNGRVRTYETNLLSEKAARGLKGLKGTKGGTS